MRLWAIVAILLVLPVGAEAAARHQIIGGKRGDHLRGTARADVMSGRQGNDVLDGRGGGGPGADDLRGGDDNDTIQARDGNTDDTIDCGPGNDTVVVDSEEDGVTNCETVVVPLQQPPPGA